MNNQVPPEWLVELLHDVRHKRKLPEQAAAAIQARFDEALRGERGPTDGDCHIVVNSERFEAMRRWQATNLQEEGE